MHNEFQQGQGEKFANYIQIDLLQLIKALFNKIWAILIAAAIGGGIGFSIANFAMTPMYSSDIMLYVNNSSFSVSGTSFSISSAEISAAQSLAKTYMVILNNRTTLEMVINKAKLPYNYKQLSNMISSGQVNSTEVLRVTVTSADPYEAATIANTIAEILPKRIKEIIKGSSMEVVDAAVPNLTKVSPSITTFTAVGFLLGAMLVCAIVIIQELADDTIHDDKYILENYKYPVLAVIPDLAKDVKDEYAYSGYNKKNHR